MVISKFDTAKSRTNLDKHGIDFVEAQALWEDPMLLQFPAKPIDEPRFVVIGRIAEKNWTAIITHRGENVRLISVRRSRVEETLLYESI